MATLCDTPLVSFLFHVERPLMVKLEANLQARKENGQTVFEIKGRDKFNKLISPIVNLNSLFSEGYYLFSQTVPTIN